MSTYSTTAPVAASPESGMRGGDNAPLFVSIAEAADTLGCKVGDVDRLIDNGQLRVVTLVDASSVDEIAARRA